MIKQAGSFNASPGIRYPELPLVDGGSCLSQNAEASCSCITSTVEVGVERSPSE